jgi:plastocyanin
MRRVVIAFALLMLFAPAAQAETLSYRFGPILVTPGQNTIEFAGNELKPPVDGWITRFTPDLSYADGTVPRVDVIHLHHGVWLSNYAPLFAAGEEKTVIAAPPGYGWRYRTGDRWVMNHMIHNLTPNPAEVYIDYELEFVPDGAAPVSEVQTVWMDVMGGTVYPVFDVHRGAGGRDGRYTYPDESGLKGYTSNRVTVQADGALVGAGGHLHPGGLWTDLTLERGGRKVRLFRSRAKYFEPAGAVSWDVAMRVTPPGWRVGVKRGDVLSVSATYDSRRASWYEAMGIMQLAFAPGGSGPDPFAPAAGYKAPGGRITHGHLSENRNHGGAFSGLADPRRLLSAPVPVGGTVAIDDFLYSRGDLLQAGMRRRPPAVRRGRALRFVNRDARRGIMHSITSCRAPCNRTTGIAYPLADGPVRFDSGNLGFGPAGMTAAANRATWKTPRRLRAGTYTYFCRIHPFMRGSFRVRR